MAPRLLLLSPSDYQSAITKGVVSLLADFDEGGFFERVLIAFPYARLSCDVNVSDRVSVRNIGTDWLPFGGRFRWLRRLLAPLHLLRTLVLLVAAVRRERISVVRATDPCFSGLIAWATARLSGRPLCVSIHADYEKRHHLAGVSAGLTVLGSRRVARVVERFVLRRADMVLPIRDSLRSYAITFGADPYRVRTIPHGADLHDFVEPRSLPRGSGLEVPPGKKIISFVGRLARENYIDDILELGRRLGVTRDDFMILMIGGGPDEARFQSIVQADPALKRIVRLAGFQPRVTVAAVRQASSVSVCLMGGFSLIEACAAASPVVSYDVEWHNELIKDGETGFLVPEHDVEKLAGAVSRLLDDSQFGKRLGKGAREFALSRHDLKKTAAIKQACYLELLAAHRSAPR